MLKSTHEDLTRSQLHDINVSEGEALTATPVASASAVSWSSLFAGAVAAAGVSLILLFAGAGLGLAVTSPWGHGASGGSIAVAAILWLGFTQVVASWLGGYLAGRLRTKWVNLHDHEVTFRDTAHGLVAWALATVITALIASSAIGSAISGGAQALGTAASAASSVLGQASGPVTSAADSLFRGPNDGAASAPAASDPALRQEASRIFTDAIRGDGQLASADSRYLAQLVAQRAGLTPDQAQQRVDATYAEVKAKVQSAEIKAKQAADKARKDSAYTALWFTIALLIGAFVASWSATYGGRTRDLA